MPHIEIQKKGRSGVRRCDMNGGRLTIGRGASNELVLHDQQISREHCVIETTGDSARILDLGSRHGMRINRKKATDAALRDGDRVRIGPYQLRYVETESDETDAGEASATSITDTTATLYDRVDRLEATLERRKAKLKKAEAALHDAREEIALLREAGDQKAPPDGPAPPELQARIEELETECEALRARVEQAEVGGDRLQQDSGSLADDDSIGEQKIADLNTRIADLERERQELEERADAEAPVLAATKEEAQQLADALNALKAEQTDTEARSRLLVEKRDEAIEEVRELHSRLEEADLEYRKLTERVDELQSRYDEASRSAESLAAFEQEAAIARDEAEACRTHTDDAERARQDAEERLAKVVATQDVLDVRLRQAEADHETAIGRLASLETEARQAVETARQAEAIAEAALSERDAMRTQLEHAERQSDFARDELLAHEDLLREALQAQIRAEERATRAEADSEQLKAKVEDLEYKMEGSVAEEWPSDLVEYEGGDETSSTPAAIRLREKPEPEPGDSEDDPVLTEYIISNDPDAVYASAPRHSARWIIAAALGGVALGALMATLVFLPRLT